ncbi:hypothetical protein PIB30_047068 [Stylosanthes scabra]|uniref:LysM domain-containing protein n=1 Tax=Stylosanthes scabra TaxID=79078 RepID=A0ABU6VF31_9FABA|nr:hypothetical protein [Stylosanthes scabra]
MALNNNNNNNPSRKRSSKNNKIADAASWCFAFLSVSLIFMCMFRDTASSSSSTYHNHHHHNNMNIMCDEIYVVGEGETLHTIADKCSDPFIVENNPHIHDPDDVYPGLVIKITPSISQHA